MIAILLPTVTCSCCFALQVLFACMSTKTLSLRNMALDCTSFTHSPAGSRILKSAEQIMQQDRRVQVSSIDLSHLDPQERLSVPSDRAGQHYMLEQAPQTASVCDPTQTPAAAPAQGVPSTGEAHTIILCFCRPSLPWFAAWGSTPV